MAREKITCLLCRGLIAFKDRNQTRFLDHMKEEHNVRFDFDVLLVATLLSEAEKVDLVGTNKEKFASHHPSLKPWHFPQRGNDKNQSNKILILMISRKRKGCC